MELCPGRTLQEFIDERRKTSKMDWKENFYYFQQILEGIKHLHEQNIIHWDLKPSNIFIDSKNVLKIGDFGLAIDQAGKRDEKPSSKKKGHWDNQSMLSIKVGTPFYLSPEQQQEKQYDEKVDIYSLGLILFELCSNFKTSH